MNPPTANTKRSLQLAKQLAEFIPGCNPLDTNDLRQILRGVGALRGTLRADQAELEDYLCGLAERMVELIERHGHIAGRQALSLVVEILTQVATSMGAELQAAAQQDTARPEPVGEVGDSAPLPGPGLLDTRVGLRMMDQRKLGEILVSLSMLTPTQVESALRHQKASGKRFGESLVELGYIKKSALDASLRMQRRQKDGPRNRPPWA
ncbi:MAG TPA: hypothetical protein VMT18_02600 [Planctomycetota bacterium]|nr:hypothetical protein [Planctomycetota bacterium]